MLRYHNLDTDSIHRPLKRFGLQLHAVSPCDSIPYSFWGAPEAGRSAAELYIRADTPIHSILHESCHFICMPSNQRYSPQVDAGGTAIEENATCYLQILLADQIEHYGREQIMRDMDEWGYSFRLGSARKWFTRDADDAHEWLVEQQIIHSDGEITWKLRL